MSKGYIGVDIGGTKIAVCVAGEDAVIKDKIRFDTIPENPSANIEKIMQAIRQLITNSGDSAAAIGISCGGPLDSKTGVILSPPNLPGWDEIAITDILQAEFGIPAFLQNDANACALAEWRFGAGRGCQNMIFLTFGTGMGAGLILDGRLYSGTTDMAGEVGHVRLAEDGPVGYGKAGSFEGFCSGGGIAQYGYGSAKEVAVKAKQGDARALDIYREVGTNLGKGLAVLIDILNPEAIVIGSIFARDRELMEGPMLEVLKEETLRYSRDCCRVVPARLGDEIGDVAAVSVGVEGHLQFERLKICESVKKYC